MMGGLLLLSFVLLTLLAVRMTRRIQRPPRELEPFRMIPREVGRALETGQPLHLALGSGGLIGSEAALTLSGRRILERLAQDGAAGEVFPFVTVADPVALLYARHVLQDACQRQGIPSFPPPDRAWWAGASPMAYAAGLTLLLGTQPVAANIISGLFREEAVLAGEIGQRYGARSIFTMPDPGGAAALWSFDPALAIGEEAFAASSLGEPPGGPSALLLTHDLIRWLLMVLMVMAALGFALRG
ncbi:MAG: hypothetical protein NZM16_09220 [Thermoflexus sp.]|uniref:DUF6754 domain-containing protein n=1 Tax=Thermoflexus sp. TaxID=1969742 RepID=UPI0025F3B0B0|nr:DUF6754 domain-containing protein [Thermoflexus sp.]MCS6964211.1 hypothetical protein [Thermoflexus sp.]